MGHVPVAMPRRFRLALCLFACLANLCAGAATAAARPGADQPRIEAESVLAQDSNGTRSVGTVAGSGRFVAAGPVAPAAIPAGIAQYGPFRVLDPGRAALVDVPDERSPAAFAAMLAAYPAIRTLELIECPGTEEDRANLRLGRMIRARGLATHVPAGGSVRSGGVELYLAGVRRAAETGAEFAVHAWADEDGREPRDYPRDAPQNRAYLDYYRAMGMTAVQARAFYDMTNSVPNRSALWLDAAQMAKWVRPE